jgi:hypothetical protein
VPDRPARAPAANADWRKERRDGEVMVGLQEGPLAASRLVARRKR